MSDCPPDAIEDALTLGSGSEYYHYLLAKEMNLMSCLDAPDHHSRFPRYIRGIDRWEFGSLTGRYITTAYSNAITVAVDETETVWWWGSERIWSTIGDPVEEQKLLQQNAIYIEKLRRAVPVMWLYLRAPYAGEKDAAFNALARMAERMTIDLRRAWNDAHIRIDSGSIYSDMSRQDESCRWQIADLHLPTFDQRVLEELFARDKPARDAYIQAQYGRMEIDDPKDTRSNTNEIA